MQKLDVDTGDIEAIAEDPKTDYMLPKFDERGNVYFIRRPYYPLGKQPYSALEFGKDVVCFPFRLSRAIFSFLNVFSMAYSKKPLTTATGHQFPGVDLKAVLLRGRMIDAERALKDSSKQGDMQSLISKSWELVKRKPNGEEEVIHQGVLAFDISPGGEVVVSNGMAIYSLNKNNQPNLISKTKLVEQITWV